MTKITNFVWNPVDDCIISELDGTGAVQAVYTNEPQQYGGVLSQRRGTTTSTYHADALGSTRFLTDSSGNVTDTYLHDAWGNSVAATGTTVNPFKWVGKYGYYTDDGTGQVYVRARMYQPTVARWVSIDPNGFSDGPVRYQYCYRNPVFVIDQSGMEGCDSSGYFSCERSPRCVECYCNLNDLFLDTELNELIKCAQSSGCLPGGIRCVPGCYSKKGDPIFGRYCGATGHIELCADSLSREPAQLFIDVIFEEVMHAITLCETAKPIDAGAFSHLRGIIEAHKVSGKEKKCLETMAEEVIAKFCIGVCTDARKCASQAMGSGMVETSCKGVWDNIPAVKPYTHPFMKALDLWVQFLDVHYCDKIGSKCKKKSGRPHRPQM